MRLAVQAAIYGALPLEEILSLAGESGFAGIELFPGQIDRLIHSPAGLRESLGRVGLDLTALFVPFHLLTMPAWPENTPLLSHRFSAAKNAGCNLIEWGGGLPRQASTPAIDWTAVVEYYHQGAAFAAQHGLRSVFHPQTAHTVDTLADLAALAEHGLDFNRIGLCPDSWQIVRTGVDPRAVFRQYASRTSHYHLADCGPEGAEPAAFGHGVVPIPELIALIRSTGYDDWIVLDSLAPDEDPLAGGKAAISCIRRHWSDSASPQSNVPAVSC